MSELQYANRGQVKNEVFYFKSYGKVIGSAGSVKELIEEMRRLEYVDPAALRYHLAEGHIVRWLKSLGESELAWELEGVVNISLGRRLAEAYLERSVMLNRMRHGRMH